MMRLIRTISLLLASVVVLSSCGEKTTTDVQPRPSLLELFDSIIEQQAGNVPRKKVYIVSHRAQTRTGIEARLPENSIPKLKPSASISALPPEPISKWKDALITHHFS